MQVRLSVAAAVPSQHRSAGAGDGWPACPQVERPVAAYLVVQPTAGGLRVMQGPHLCSCAARIGSEKADIGPGADGRVWLFSGN